MDERWGATLLTVLLVGAVLAGGVGAAAAAHREDPRFETSVPEPVLQPGTTQQLTVELTNDAANYDDQVEEALDVHATVGSVAGVDVLSGTRELESMGDGETRAVSVRVDVPTNIPAGTYEVPITVAYRDVDDTDERVTTTVTATIRVRERARFAIQSVKSNAPVGGSGTVAVTVENVGERAAENAVAQVRSANTAVTFGGSPTASRFVGDIAPGETQTVTVEAAVAASADQREYALDLTMEYETPDGAARSTRPLAFGVVPTPEQTFAVDNLNSTLRVGEEGRLQGVVTNTGDTRVTNAVVTIQTANPNIALLEPEVAVGSLAPGESAQFGFDIEVSDAAEAGPRQFTLQVDYRNTADERRQSDTIDAPVSIAPTRSEFTVRAVNGSLAAGATGRLTLAVTNERDEPVSDVSAKLFLDAPLSSSDDEGFIDRLAPGETRRVTFDLSAAQSALVGKTYPAKVDFQYETAEGDSRISDTYRIPVTTTAPTGGGLPFGLTVGPLGLGAGLVGLSIVGLGAVYVRRR
ncbi:COG1361 S-layer family protein [Halosegnis sp.]|uniref:COG1361 S-layer family protein n=1 Tax=Halosegnis sp. TaxID=2864959 RepID=UPI0035D45FFE